jgi:small subunit ribosomal protein S4e
MHVTRQNINKSWPIARKGTKYIVVPSHSPNDGLPLLIIMRDILEIVKTRKELNRILYEKKVEVNDKPVRNDNYTLLLFDTLSLKGQNKFYKVNYTEGGKLGVEEIKEKDVGEKISKVISRKILKGNRMQLNFNDGRNILSKEKVKIGDSVIIKLKEGKIEKVLPIKEKAKVLIIKGKHRGHSGEITKVEDKKAEIKSEGKILETKTDELIVLN